MVAVVFATSSLGCGSSSADDDPGENKYLPTKFFVAIPKALQKSGASSDLKGASRSHAGRNLGKSCEIMTNTIDAISYIGSFAAKGNATTSTAYNAKMNAAAAKPAEMPDLVAVTQ